MVWGGKTLLGETCFSTALFSKPEVIEYGAAIRLLCIFRGKPRAWFSSENALACFGVLGVLGGFGILCARDLAARNFGA